MWNKELYDFYSALDKSTKLYTLYEYFTKENIDVVTQQEKTNNLEKLLSAYTEFKAFKFIDEIIKTSLNKGFVKGDIINIAQNEHTIVLSSNRIKILDIVVSEFFNYGVILQRLDSYSINNIKSREYKIVGFSVPISHS